MSASIAPPAATLIKPKRCYVCRELFQPETSRTQRCDACAPSCPVCEGPTLRRGHNCAGCRGCRRRAHAGALLDMHTSYEDDDRCWYVVEAHPDGLTLEQIGSLFGVTRERIRQIETQALRHFTARLALAGITEDDVRELFARRAQGA